MQPEWAALPVAERAACVRAIRERLVARADEVAAAIAEETGKTRIDALATEVLPAALAISYYARRARSILGPRRLRGGSLLFLNKRSTVHRVPWGVVGIISPWNYPLGIPMHEIIPALLAGNGVIFKTAPETLGVGRVIAELMTVPELPPGLFSLVESDGPATGDLFLSAQGVDKLFFTGSVAVGKILMARAVETLTPVCLELGGNDPMLVCPDAPLERAVNGAVWAGLQNSGQTCAGVERLYVHRAIYEPFMARLRARVQALRVGPDTDHDADIGAMCTTRQASKVREQIADAVARGARVHAQASLSPNLDPKRFVAPVVLTNVDHDMTIMREETFGPVLCVMAVDDMQQAVALANDSMLALTASVWSADRRSAEALARRVHAGVLTINDHLVSHGMAETPWGGFKDSGLGRSHGELGLEEMTAIQVVVDERLPFLRRNVFWHPYDAGLYRGLRGLLDAMAGRGLGSRLRGAAQFARLLPRMFRD
jgi:succinate-semialdehyde dehydrogenase/glutarate-semialdehyde dehydrogenase